jgi:hypothetical protein
MRGGFVSLSTGNGVHDRGVMMRRGVLLLLLMPAAVRSGTVEVPYPVERAIEGERCTVCGAVLSEDDVALVVRGRRVPLDKDMVGEFLKEPERYFAHLQPKGALFQENGDASGATALGGVSRGWFLAGLYVLVALVFAGLSGYAAVGKGLKPIPHFFIGLLFSLFGYLYVLTRPAKAGPGEVPRGLAKVPLTRDPVPCGSCGALNHPSAKRCSGCGTGLEPRVESEVARV